jgi:hypothetical protein
MVETRSLLLPLQTLSVMSTCERSRIPVQPCIVLMPQPRLRLRLEGRSSGSAILLTSDLASERSTPVVGLNVADIAIPS